MIGATKVAATTRIKAISTRREQPPNIRNPSFGKIVKQRPKCDSQRKEVNKENCQEESFLFNKLKRWKHLDFLLEKKKSKGIHEPFDRYIYSIFKRTREDFENKGFHTIYNNISKELIAPDIKTSIKDLSAITFTPVLVKELMKEVYGSNRWYKLYLIKILYKEGLLRYIKELVGLSEKTKKSYFNYCIAYKKFNKLKYLLTNCNALNEQFLTPLKKSEVRQQNIEKLNQYQIETQEEHNSNLLKVHSN